MKMTPFLKHRDKAIILYDGVCILCNGFVQFLLRRDQKDIFRFAPIQAEEVEQWLASQLDEELREDTVILWYKDSLYTKSDVSVQVLRLLPFPWPVLSVMRFIPKSIRDGIYDWIARKRYKWFGKKEQCPIPTPEDQRRFIAWPND